MVGVPEKENVGLADAISDQEEEALMEKKGMQGLERSSTSILKTRTESCPEGDDEAVES